MSDHHPAWGLDGVVPLICDHCDWRYLVPEGGEPSACPHCASPGLTALDADDAHFPYVYPPELVVPFSVDRETVDGRIRTFAGDIPFPPADLNPETLGERMRRLFMPMWLVDAEVAAEWRAEVGFDYEVVSHQERYADGAGWQTREVREERTRWEPRVGRLARRYDNVTAPALGGHEQLERVLGRYDLRRTAAYRPDMLSAAVVRAPDREPDAAWPDAELVVRQRAAGECQTAAQADHIRDFRWSPHYADRHWTLLLLPTYATHYLDDEGQPQQVLLHGQTGQLHGLRRGSMAQARSRALIIGAVALVIFVLGLLAALLGFVFPPLSMVGLLAVLLALPIGAGAVIPIVRVWSFNRRQAKVTYRL